jgi:hypothetical protein
MVILVLLPLSCTKLPEAGAPGKGNVAFETLTTKDTVPLKWGNLVSVSTSPNMSYVFQLWLQDEEGNLRMVIYDMRANILRTDARFIPRK